MRKWISMIIVFAVLFSLTAVPAAATEPGEFIIALRGEQVTESALEAIRSAGGTVTERIDDIGVLKVRADDSAAFIRSVAKSPELESIAPSVTLPWNLPETGTFLAEDAAALAIPTDPAAYTWGIDQVTENGAAWEVHQGTKDVVVGVLDSGIDLTHPDLAPNVVPGSKSMVPGDPSPMDVFGHGTHVAGTIAANGRIKGVAPGVGIRSYRVGTATRVDTFWVINGIITAANDGVDVINMSLGGIFVRGQVYYVDPATGERIRLGNDNAMIVAYERALRYAVRQNVTVVAAAGNDGLNLANRTNPVEMYNELFREYGIPLEFVGAATYAPGPLPGVITVSATGGGWGTPDRLAFYSNYGAGVTDLAAPGGDLGPNHGMEPDAFKYLILSTMPTYYTSCWQKGLFGDCSYGFMGGTSMASPHVAGAAALLISEEYASTGKKPSPAQVTTRLQQFATDAGKIGYDELYGHGILNVYRAMIGR